MKLKSLPYYRDLGGISTSDGRLVRSGVLYRTSDFSKISNKDLKQIEENIFACFDLRTDEEIKVKPDVFEGESFYHHVPLLSNKDNPAVTKENRTAILKMRMKQEGGMPGQITLIYRQIIKEELARENLKKIFKLLLQNTNLKTVVYHCTQGKDRTGMLSAIILLALGVKKEDIIKDYLIYNRHDRFKRILIRIGVTLKFFSLKTARQLNSALAARYRYISAAFEEMDNIYGSPDNYLRNGIGLSEENLKRLQELYLVGA